MGLLFRTEARLAGHSSITIDAIHDNVIDTVGKGQKPAKLCLMPSVQKVPSDYSKVRVANGTNKVLTNHLSEPMMYDGIRQEIYEISGKVGIEFSARRA